MQVDADDRQRIAVRGDRVIVVRQQIAQHRRNVARHRVRRPPRVHHVARVLEPHVPVPHKAPEAVHVVDAVAGANRHVKIVSDGLRRVVHARQRHALLRLKHHIVPPGDHDRIARVLVPDRRVDRNKIVDRLVGKNVVVEDALGTTRVRIPEQRDSTGIIIRQRHQVRGIELPDPISLEIAVNKIHPDADQLFPPRLASTGVRNRIIVRRAGNVKAQYR